MVLKDIIKIINKSQMVHLIVNDNYTDYTNYTFNIDDMKTIEFIDSLYDYKVLTAFTEYDETLKENKMVIEIQENLKQEKVHRDTYFYGIDFKKIRVYCKVKFISSIKVKNLFRQRGQALLEIDSDKYYYVDFINFDDEILKITVHGTRLKYQQDHGLEDYKLVEYSEDRYTLTLQFDDVEFSYFFEDTFEDELEKNIF